MSTLLFQSSVNFHLLRFSNDSSLMREYSLKFLCYLVVVSFILVIKPPICDYAMLQFPLCVITCLWHVNVL